MRRNLRRTSLLLLTLLLLTLPTAASAQNTLTTAADQGTSGLFFSLLCPGSDITINKDDADVFSIRLDNGTPYFMQLRRKSGKYIIKAGDHVVVKTLEASEVALESVSGKSSSIWPGCDNVIMLSEDKTVDDFKAAHPVNEGEYIYLLTNMEKNGGFGFTLFTGDTMRKGCFFIVSSKKPAVGAESRASASVPSRAATRAAQDIEDGDTVPFLEGEAGNDDGFKIQTVIAPGDANGDGLVNVTDIVETVNYICGAPSAAFVFSAADVNKDGKVDTEDINLIVGAIMATK